MFELSDNIPFDTVMEGVEKKTLVYGDRTLMTVFRLKKGSAIPSHAHPHEQTGYLVSGRIQLTVAEQVFDAAAGAGWSIPGDVDHSAVCLEDAVALEVFAPVREDYLP